MWTVLFSLFLSLPSWFQLLPMHRYAQRSMARMNWTCPPCKPNRHGGDLNVGFSSYCLTNRIFWQDIVHVPRNFWTWILRSSDEVSPWRCSVVKLPIFFIIFYNLLFVFGLLPFLYNGYTPVILGCTHLFSKLSWNRWFEKMNFSQEPFI